MSERTATLAPPTPLAAALAPSTLVPFAGVHTPAWFTTASDELEALQSGAGIFDLGWRARLRITGDDRVRWLNGMVTNTVKDLAPGRILYTFLLNAQGRIQGDGELYALPHELLLATDAAQAPKLAAHLDRFIIMDDVELSQESGVTAIGVAGPRAAEVLQAAGLEASLPDVGSFHESGSTLVAQESAEQSVLWVADEHALPLWTQLREAGATRCGIQAVEAWRILRGVPRYGADIDEKSLAQETGQLRALNFNKGCYLGQEIVERIRSRATVHKALRAFALNGDAPAPGTALFAEGKPETAVGTLTSVTSLSPHGALALGTVRTEAAGGPLTYAGGVATVLAHAPLQTF